MNGVHYFDTAYLEYGVFQASDGECERSVLDALGVGYRSVDAARSYGNEEGVGRAIGVSDFYPNRLADLCRFVEVMPAVDQVEPTCTGSRSWPASPWTSTASGSNPGVPSRKVARTSSRIPS